MKYRFFTVAWGPVPREHWIARTMARDRPAPYSEGVAFFIVARGPVPRDFICLEQDLQEMSRIYKISKSSKIRGFYPAETSL